MHDADRIDVERYELFEASRYRFDFDRRDFVKTFGTGLLVMLVAGFATGAQHRRQNGAGSRPGH